MSQNPVLDEKRRTVSELGRKMLRQGLTKGTGGNISVREGDQIAISPSGIPYDEIDPEDVPVIDLEGERIAGDTDPSSEFRMHSGIIRERDDVGAVVHTHSPYASTFASLDQSVLPSHYLIAFVGDEIPVAPYETYGTAELAEAALETLGDDYNACLLKNHGVIAVGEDAEAAYEVALMVEYVSRIHYQALNAGDPELLPDERIQDLIEIFEGYGQSSDTETAIAEPATDLRSEREAVADLGREMLAQGLTEGTGGNISYRNGDRVAINPSGVPYEEIDPEDVPLVSIDGEQVAGELGASSEKPMHLQIMRERDDVGAVVHTHSPYASTFASLQEPIPATHYLIAFAGKEVPVTDYYEPGTERLGQAAVDALGEDNNACLLGNHGVITVGEDAEAAFEVALMVEYCARIHYQGSNIGEPTHLPDAELEHLFDRFSDYGQSG
ncbi:class II aldolase/adducin family protein [Halobellus marinus]|jgi:L-fuculose-phosphate aldolase|uniref:class II aldolase/adducin family protein n=1 Tax=Halobellus TaxID=1073986 RepID=UPI0028AFFA36|nr:class II aldolase/adducin family protein [Halobellus sp. DFY28]